MPHTHLEPVKQALFSGGAGRVGDYEHCCWQVEGIGQFRPLAGSQPFIGQQDTLEQVAEYRLELICEEACVHQALANMLATHPYEEPAYGVLPMATFNENGLIL